MAEQSGRRPLAEGILEVAGPQDEEVNTYPYREDPEHTRKGAAQYILSNFRGLHRGISLRSV